MNGWEEIEFSPLSTSQPVWSPQGTLAKKDLCKGERKYACSDVEVGHLNWLPTIRLFDIRTKDLAFQKHSGIWSEPEKTGVGYLGTATRLPTIGET